MNQEFKISPKLKKWRKNMWKKIFLEPWLKAGAGSAKGLIHIGEDFDDELPDFKEYME